MQSFLLAIALGGLIRFSGTHPTIYFVPVHASIDPSQSSSNSFSSYQHSYSISNSNNKGSSDDFTYRHSYQLNLLPSSISLPGNSTDCKIDEDISFRESKSKNTKATFDTWIQKINSKLEKVDVVNVAYYDGVYDDNDDDDDEDQDNDDGHSSMLSTRSLHRKQLHHQPSSPHFITTTYRSRNDRSSGSHRRKLYSKVHTTRTSSVFHQMIHTPRSNELIVRVSRGGSRDGSILNNMIDQNSPKHSPAWILQWLILAYQSQVGRNLIVSAIVTLVFEALIGHILEFLKIVMQTSSSSNPNISYLQVIQTITAEKGILGLWDGFCPWGIVQAVCKGAVFGLAHAAALQTLRPLAEQRYIPMALALTLAGGIGGGFQGYILSPTLLLKTRVMTNPVFREKMSAWRTTLLSFTIGYDVVKQEGLGALMKGANVFATKRVFDWASRYFFADLFEDLFTQIRNGSSLSVAEKSAASLLGGVFSTMVTLPLDVLVAKTQDAKKAGIAVSPIKLFQDELREKGWNGIRNAYMRGFEARLLHVCLTTVVIKTGTPIAYEAIFGSK